MNATDIELKAGRRGIAGGSGLRSGMADWLGLAAAPAFAVMALLTAASGGGAAEMLCSAAHASPLGGMVPMYLLMTAFHLAPWLKLFGHRQKGV